MAQENFNVSFPNDGLGDELRAAFIKQQNMNTELYDTKVDKESGKGLSSNDYSNEDKSKVANIVSDAEKNVQADWNETDPTSDAYIKGKPVFESGEIIVSALWTGTGFIFDVIADAFPVSGLIYSANPAEITLSAADVTLDRIDLIVAQKPQGTAQLGAVGVIEGTPASSALVVPPDYDPSEYYIIKQVTIKAAATEPDGAENIVVFEDGNEWTPTLTPNVAITTNDPSTGTHSAEGTSTLATDNVFFDNGAELSTEIIDLLTFDFKLKNPLDAVGRFFVIYIHRGGTLVKQFYLQDGQNGFNSQSSSYQTISITKAELNLNIENFDGIRLRPFFASSGWYIDNIQIRKGSGSETLPVSGIPEAPADGNLYGRKNQSWEQLASSGIPTAQQIKGDTIRLVNQTGSVNIDWTAASAWLIGINLDTITLVDINLPALDKNDIKTIYTTVGDVSDGLLLPAYWVKDSQSDDFIGNEKNRITVECISGASGSELVHYSITNLG